MRHPLEPFPTGTRCSGVLRYFWRRAMLELSGRPRRPNLVCSLARVLPLPVVATAPQFLLESCHHPDL